MARIQVSQAGVVGMVAAWAIAVSVAVSAQAVKNPEAAKLKNPVKATADSIAAGQVGVREVLQVLPRR